MDYILAKNKILSLWKEGGLAYEKINQEEYKQIYYAVLSHLKGGNNEWNQAVGEFLKHGAMSYDRFYGLPPKVADDEQYDMFSRFLNTLKKIDGNYLGRTAFFLLHRIQWDIYSSCSLKPSDENLEESLTECVKDVQSITVPEDNPKVFANIEKMKVDLLELINNIRLGHIRTTIHTTLPYKLANTDSTIHMTMDGITTTTCDLTIEAHCLIDLLKGSPKVILRGGADNGGYWTEVFNFTYKVVCMIWAYVHQHEDVSGSWPPLPNDIHYLQSRVYA